MRIIQAASYRRMAWKNGAGETVEIAISPPDASLDAFDWRVSMARVASGGPFSRFPGVDRTLAVLTGAGTRLSVAGRDAVTLGRDAEPFAFSGDDAAAAELIEGPIEDLNAMTHRARYRHRMSRLSAAAPVTLRRDGDLLLVIVRGSAVMATAAGSRLAIGEGDTILLDRDAGRALEITPDGPAELYAIEIWRA